MEFPQAIEDALAVLGRDAETLEELTQRGRASAGSPDAGKNSSASTAIAIVNRWCFAVARGDRARFQNRLSWDGVNAAGIEEAIMRALDHPPEQAASWTEPLRRVLGAVPPTAAEADNRVETIPDAAQSANDDFVEVWQRFASSAAADLWGSEQESPVLSASARRDLQDHLLRMLCRVGRSALNEYLVQFQTPSNVRSDHAEYARFIESLAGRGILAVLRRYPALARQVATVTKSWMSATDEFIGRLEGDFLEIESEFFAGKKVGAVIGVCTGLSDPHRGGRRVLRLRFESGHEIIYKPRTLVYERGTNTLLAWLGENGLRGVSPTVRTLAKDGYGWMEFVRTAEHTLSTAQVEEFAAQAGVLVCIAHVLGASDLHSDNVVVTKEGPVLLDLETIFSRGISLGPGQLVGDTPGSPPSCVDSGLASFLQIDSDGRILDASGLCTLPAHWRFQAAIERGFTATYQALTANRKGLVDEGLLASWFCSGATRVVVRDTSTYVDVLRGILEAPIQRHGYAPGLVVETLHRPFAIERQPPWLWPLVAEESRSLQELDVPVFEVDFDGTDLYHSSGVIPAFADQSGREVANSRLQSLSDADLEQQLDRLRLVLGPKDLVAPLRPTSSDPDVPGMDPWADPLVRIAGHLAEDLWVCLKNELITAESSTENSLWTCYMNTGICGPALLYGALFSLTNREEYRHRARVTADRIIRTVSANRGPDGEGSIPVGACTGIGGILYVLTCLARYLDTDEYQIHCRSIASWIGRISDHSIERCDVEGGAAGALHALCALWEASGEPVVLDTAVRCGKSLLARATPIGEALAWEDAEGIYRAGFAHGASGIASAIARLWKASLQADFLRASRQAFEFEKRLYNPEWKNWPVATQNALDSKPARHLNMKSWCHGAPGVALGRILVADLAEELGTADDLQIALDTTLETPMAQYDHLCCGNLGRVDVLLSAADATKDQPLRRSTAQRAVGVVSRAIRRGGFAHSSETTDSISKQSLFHGTCGIAYELLRLSRPDKIPSVLGLQLPSEPRDQTQSVLKGA